MTLAPSILFACSVADTGAREIHGTLGRIVGWLGKPGTPPRTLKVTVVSKRDRASPRRGRRLACVDPVARRSCMLGASANVGCHDAEWARRGTRDCRHIRGPMPDVVRMSFIMRVWCFFSQDFACGPDWNVGDYSSPISPHTDPSPQGSVSPKARSTPPGLSCARFFARGAGSRTVRREKKAGCATSCRTARAGVGGAQCYETRASDRA